MLILVDFVPLGDGSYRAIPRKPVEVASVAVASKLTGIPVKTIYQLYATGFIEGTQASPRKITIYLPSLTAHIEKAKDPEFWTRAHALRYDGGRHR